MSAQTPIYGLLAEFDDVTTLVDATKRVHQEGYTRFDAYTPFPSISSSRRWSSTTAGCR